MVAPGHGAVLTERVAPGRIAPGPRGPRRRVDEPYVAATVAREHAATARALEIAELMAKNTH